MTLLTLDLVNIIFIFYMCHFEDGCVNQEHLVIEIVAEKVSKIERRCSTLKNLKIIFHTIFFQWRKYVCPVYEYTDR
jgi:hypothetical protein